MNTPHSPHAALPWRLLVQADDRGTGWWAFAVVHSRVVGALLLPDAESARRVGHEIHATNSRAEGQNVREDSSDGHLD